MKINFILLPMIILITGCGRDPSGTDFSLNSNIAARFEQDEVYVNVSAASDCSQAGITKEDILLMAEEAGKRFWNRVPSSRLKIRKGQQVNVSSYFETGEICESIVSDPGSCPADAVPQVTSDILIACNTDTTTNFPLGNGIIALAMPNRLEGQFIRGAVLLINDTANSPFSNFTRDQKIVIIAHEIGHTIGLGHSPAKRALMYYDSAYDHYFLAPEDIKGATFLYPKKEKFAGVAGCGTISTPDDNDTAPPFNGLPSTILCMALTTLIIRLLKYFARMASTERCPIL